MPQQHTDAAAAAGASAQKNGTGTTLGTSPLTSGTADDFTPKSPIFQGLSEFGEQEFDEENALGGAIATPFENLRPEPVRWLWPGWLARGKVHLLAGRPGAGKTTLALSLAAAISSTGYWPDGSDALPGRVAVLSTEDDPSDTLLPRLIAAGANRSQVFAITGACDEFGAPRPFDPITDIHLLESTLRRIKPALLIVDPIVSFIAGDSHKNTEVRRDLQPLVDLAASVDCAVLGITHLGKGSNGRDPTERVIGSIAFAAVARVVMLAAKNEDPAAEFPRMLVRSKSNIGSDEGGFEYDIRQADIGMGISTSVTVWGKSLSGNARDLIAKAEVNNEDYRDGGSLEDACSFLKSLLEDGPLPAKTVRAEADGAGYSWATIRRAKDRIGAEARKDGGEFGGHGSVWKWALCPQGAQ